MNDSEAGMVEKHYREHGSDDDEDEPMQITRAEQVQAGQTTRRTTRQGLIVHLMGGVQKK